MRLVLFCCVPVTDKRDDGGRVGMNSRRINSSVIVPRMPRPPQQTSQWPLRVPADRLSRDFRLDVTGRPVTVSGRRCNTAEGRRTNGLPDRARVRPETNACWTSGFSNEGTGCRRQPLCREKWPSKIEKDVGVSQPVANGRRKFTQPIDRKEFLVTSGAGRPKINCDQMVVGRGISNTIAKPGAKCRNFLNTMRPEPEGEISKPQKDGESSENDGSTDDVAAVGEDDLKSQSSRDSVSTSITWYNGDDVTQVPGELARASGVFSRMSTEAQQAWIAVKQSEISAAASIDEPETKCFSATSGSDSRQTTTLCDSHRHRSKYSTRETAYNVFEPRSNRLIGVTAVSYTHLTLPTIYSV